MNLPNILTLSRIVMIPVFVLVYYLPVGWSGIACGVVFSAAAATDWLDGYLARRLNQSTPFGAFLDPVADKLMVAMSLTVLVEHHGAWWMTIPALVIIGREIVISALREWMAERGKSAEVAVSYVGKVKTFAQMWAIVFLLFGSQVDWSFWLGLTLLYLAAGLTIYSMYQYLTASWSTLFVE
jgi:CDP-diacylglycerol--glycerol-3-phosphate 3-phosphatidyltransferase